MSFPLLLLWANWVLSPVTRETLIPKITLKNSESKYICLKCAGWHFRLCNIECRRSTFEVILPFTTPQYCHWTVASIIVQCELLDCSKDSVLLTSVANELLDSNKYYYKYYYSKRHYFLVEGQHLSDLICENIQGKKKFNVKTIYIGSSWKCFNDIHVKYPKTIRPLRGFSPIICDTLMTGNSLIWASAGFVHVDSLVVKL